MSQQENEMWYFTASADACCCKKNRPSRAPEGGHIMAPPLTSIALPFT